MSLSILLSVALVACGDDAPSGADITPGGAGGGQGAAGATSAAGGGGTAGASAAAGEAGAGATPLACSGARAGVKRAFWGDLHVHTSYSFDAFFFDSLNGPTEAYAFAKGAANAFPCGDDPDTPCRTAKLDVPLDFAAVTDHAEFLGLATVCGAGGAPVQNPALCTATGNYIRDNIATIVSGGSVPQGLIDLLEGLTDPADSWARIIAAADAANDPCAFTSFVAFEHSAQPNGGMLHRNVVFRGSTLPTTPVSSFDALDEWELFNRLDAACPHGPAGVDCDYLSIPHNANLSDGRMFQATPLAGAGDAPATQAQAAQRARADVLVELMQHKGDSECGLGYASPLTAEEDTACGFEKVKRRRDCGGPSATSPACKAECVTPATSAPGGVAAPEDCTAPLDQVRDALVEGLRLQDAYAGVNPYKVGFVGATDTHNGDPGNVREDAFFGHGGVLDDEPAELLGAWQCPDGATNCAPGDRTFNTNAFLFNPGGLTAVWAEQNTRDDLFAALQRRETYATSGPRITLKVYAAWGTLPADLCASLEAGTDPVEAGLTAAVPMGADLPTRPEGARPQLAVRAVADPTLGTPLQRLEIIKGWVDDAGAPHAQVFPVVGDPSGPKPDNACAVTKANEPEQLCGVWTDPAFVPSQRAFYYARALENPTCRWSTALCVQKGVDCAALNGVTGTFPAASPFAGHEGCCDITPPGPLYSGQNRFDTIEERAWGSPVWYSP